MNHTKLFATICIVSALTCKIKAQDIHFSQFYMAPLQQNPAMAGANHDLEAILNYKNQWASITSPYRTIAFTYDMRLTKAGGSKKGYWAAGINFYSDNSGDANMGTTQGNLTVAYHVLTGLYSQLGAGVMGGYAQRSVNYSALQWGNQYDGSNYNPSLPTGEPYGANNSIPYIDGAAGVEWSYDNTSGGINVTDNHDLKGNIGFAMFHVNQPKYSFYGEGEKLLIRYSFHADALVSISGSSIALAPGLIYYQQGGANEFYIGTLVRCMLQQSSKYTGIFKSAALSIGAYYRNQDAIVAAMLLEYGSYAMGISYDFNTSTLTSASNGMGGIELSLRFVLPNPYSGSTGKKAMF
ncbi:MAG TPA: PorP/SprF family type IX secretion system membrane protein [Bacteroidia bacterium]|jgi:type IX secretion system PorP/SprF family membrane protein|nr:PorP/SprF family type IX secretion system membrane protein [Bacteroidia bacterium]